MTPGTLLLVVLRRVLLAVPLLFIVTALSFVLLSLLPGDPARNLLGPLATQEQVDALREQMGLNSPLWEQYWQWVVNALHGDLGRSLVTQQTVTEAIGQRLPVTISIAVCCLLVIPVVGIALGVLSALSGGVVDRGTGFVALVGVALPSFWLGAMLIAVFAVKLRWFPAVGYVPLTDSPSEWARSLVLPVAAISIGAVVVFARQSRDAMRDALASEHVRLAWARGVPARDIYFRYALKSIGPVMLTLVGLLTIGLLAGTLFVETVFALPGIGIYAVTGAQQQDIPVVQGTTLVFTLIIVVVNLLTDLAYTALDPRVRSS